jgi:hypothetical protein
MRATTHAIVVASLLLPTACARGKKTPTAAEGQTVQVVEPRERNVAADADAPLRAMSDYLAGLEHFAVHTEGSIEMVLADGQKVAFPFESNVWVRRPSSLRSDRITEHDPVQFFYDGKTFTLYGKRTGFYAQLAAPDTIDRAIDEMNRQLDLEAPGADLLHKDSYAVLLEDVVSGFNLGSEVIDGAECHHLAFRGNEVDWQIWIEQGARPVPRRYIITSKKVQGSPQFSVDFSEWNTKTKLSDKVFVFEPPAGAQKIEFLTTDTAAKTKFVTQLPAGCVLTSGPAYNCAGTIYRPYYHNLEIVFVPSPDAGRAP